MRRLITVAGFIALVAAACGSASSSPSPSTAAPASPSATTVTVHVTFDGKECKYVGPASVAGGTKLVFVFENTPAGVADSTAKSAVTIGSDLVVIETTAGTTWGTVEASLPVPAGTKGRWPDPAWAVSRAAYGIGPSATVMTSATGAAYYVGCHQYWDKAGGTTVAAYPATVIQVLKG